MRRFVITTMVAVLAGLLALLGAAPAHAYPEPQIRIEFGDLNIVSGETFRVTVSASVDCLWTATLEGQRRAGSGKRFTARFTAPQVTRTTRFPLRVTCSYVDPSTSRAGARGALDARSLAVASPSAAGTRSTVSRTFTVTVYPRRGQGGPKHGGGQAGLADTGGPSLWWPVAGAALLLAGAATLASRRRGRR